jgi:hypothetical protein
MPIHARQQNTLQTMVDDVNKLPGRGAGPGSGLPVENTVSPFVVNEIEAPRLTVDDDDGVVDVDISLPGFVGIGDMKTGSQPSSLRHYSPSLTGTDDGDSSYGSRPHRTDRNGSSFNVAGFLKRYHEDFILQSVKPYPELQEDVKRSMLQEENPTDDLRSPMAEEESNGERWISVCTTLLADVRTFTIRRVTLRCRLGRAASSAEVMAGTSPSKNTETSINTKNRNKPNSPPSEKNPSQQFIVETVMDFDTTLTDAIERILHDGDPPKTPSALPSNPPSRAVSTGTTTAAASVRSEPLQISGPGKARDWRRGAAAAQSDCRQAVVEALEEVVKSVNDDLAKHHRVDGQLKIDGKELNQELRQDNVLREGVKKWLLNVETRSVW